MEFKTNDNIFVHAGAKNVIGNMNNGETLTIAYRDMYGDIQTVQLTLLHSVMVFTHDETNKAVRAHIDCDVDTTFMEVNGLWAAPSKR